MISKIKKVPEFISYALKHKLINLIEIITVVGMGIVTYDYGYKVFNGNVLQAAILVVVIEGTSVAFMLNSYGLTPKVRLTYIGCLLLISGLINIIHAAKIGDENLDSYFSILIAALSVLNIFAFNLISVLKKNPDLNIKAALDLNLGFKDLENKLKFLNDNLDDLNSKLNIEKQTNSKLNSELNLLNQELSQKINDLNESLNQKLSEEIRVLRINDYKNNTKEKNKEKINLNLKKDLSEKSSNKKRGRPSGSINKKPRN